MTTVVATLPYASKKTRIVLQFCPITWPAYNRMPFHTSALRNESATQALSERSDIPAKKETTARVPERNRLTMMTQYPYL